MTVKDKKCVVVFSGGQDSTTCLGLSLKTFEETHAISFFYGQKHNIELERAKAICEKLNVPHTIIDISFFGDLVDSALTHGGNVNEKHPRLKHLPASFVPNRNMMFLTIAHAFAQKIGADYLMTGVCETDFSGYCDCRNDFIKLAEDTLNIGTYGYALNPDWIAGFIEGDGWFTRQSYKLKNGEKRYYPVFAIQQNEFEILNQMKEFFGTGNIRENKIRGDSLTKKRNWTLKISGNMAYLVANLMKSRIKTLKRRVQFDEWMSEHKKYFEGKDDEYTLNKYKPIKILTPLMWMNKAQTWKLAEEVGFLDVVRTMSHTCYNGSEKMNEWGCGCGECPACNLRQKGYEEYISGKHEPFFVEELKKNNG